ncbi:MAG: SDR family NAD(P)-dependent oxidoreductase [Planctomycetes bacterium]|nr:SDR family NAD(P)-dependent oxidoreductase [Planctomycetota bacterium]
MPHPSTSYWTGRRAVVTGAASGLGRALAVRLGQGGAHVAVADIDTAGAASTLEQVCRAGGSGSVEPLDVRESESWHALLVRLRREWPAIDLLVNNAGVAGSGEMGTMPLEDWRWLMEVNLWGAIYGCHAFVPWLKENPRGAHVLNIASLAAFTAAPAMAAYNVSKAGVLTLSETLYAELAAKNVGVTVVCPGFFATNLAATGRFGATEHRDFVTMRMRRASITADSVAQAALAAVERKRLYVVLPARVRRWWWLKRLLPGVFTRFLARAYPRGLPQDG